MLELLEQLFRQVRSYMLSSHFNYRQVYYQSPDHTTMQFDREAEEIIVRGLMESGHAFEIVSEERPAFNTADSPLYRIVIDPVDGSNNVARGIMTAAVALAVLPIEAPIAAEFVQWALVGELFSGTVYESQHGGGAFRNGRRCQVSETTRLSESIVGMNFDDGRDLASLGAFLTSRPGPAKVRRTGSSAIDVAYVASGAYDALIDIGDALTGESFLASLGIVLEAGGCVSDRRGENLRPITNLSAGFSLIVAGTRQLQAEILAQLPT